jgi:hypothetical protein
MSRPRKIHPPIKGDFNSVLGAVAMGSGKGKKAAVELHANRSKPLPQPPLKKP